MNFASHTWLLTARTIVQFPRNPMVLVFAVMPALMMFVVFGTLFEGVRQLPGFPSDSYYAYLAPAAVLMTTVPGISNSAVALATDFQNRYFYKLLTSPASIGAILLGRLAGDGIRLFVQAGGMLLVAMAFGAHVETGLAGALLMLLIGSLFAVVTFGTLTANLALKTKDPAAVQAVFPMAFLLIFLTSAFQTKVQIESGVLRALIDVNPTEHVLRAMRGLMLSGYDWRQIAIAFSVILALALVGMPLTVRNYRSAYR